MEDSHPQLVQYTNQAHNLDLPTNLSQQALEAILAQYVQQLMDTNFNALVQLLYRVDVPEDRLQKLLLTDPQTDAAIHISHLMVQRQLQKIESRKAWRTDNPKPPPNEAW